VSYDVSLLDPVTGETLDLPYQHLMIGGTYQADYDEHTGKFSPKATTEAYLNITYNYSKYYSEATNSDPRFAHDEPSYYRDDGSVGKTITEYGLRGLNGKTGFDSIYMLQDMIDRLERKYHPNGIWLTTERVRRVIYMPKINKAQDINMAIDDFGFCHSALDNAEYYNVYMDVYEGSTDNYWFPTAACALRPLYQLLTMAKLRPDGVLEVL
jgi:hypothetical protein